jgi:hypothetical protein
VRHPSLILQAIRACSIECILAQSDKSREREGSALAVKKPTSLFMIRSAPWYANCVART